MAVSNSQHPWHLSQVNVFSGFPVCSDQYICFPALEMRKLGLRVSIRKTFAQFFWNETQNFSFFAHQFCAKKQQFVQSFPKVISRKIALFRFCETQVLPNSATRVLRNSAISWKSNTWWRCVFLRIQFWKNLVLESLPIGHFYIIDQWQLRRVQI